MGRVGWVRWLVAVVAGLLAGVPAAGAAPVDFTATQSSRTLRFHGGAATVTLTFKTLAAASIAEVGLEPSTWQDSLVRGSPLHTFDRRIVGPGRITGHYSQTGETDRYRRGRLSARRARPYTARDYPEPPCRQHDERLLEGGFGRTPVDS